MNRLLRISPFFAVLLSVPLLLSEARAQEPQPVHYALAPGSTFQSGCFEPCECPILEELPLAGTFDLAFLPTAGPLDVRAVENVSWTVPALGKTITGSGTYTRVGELNRLSLGLAIDGDLVQDFTSGFVPAGAEFPEIDVLMSMHELYCYDIALHVRAVPIAEPKLVLSVAQDTLSWTPESTAGFDVVCGDLGELASSGGDFTAATDQCLAEDLAGTELPYALSPASGGAVWFLVREVGGTYDAGAGSPVEPRDAEIDASVAACP